ncbi:MAG: DUF2807 domain-containing protein [Prevotellaceae bacterium]|jgi:hypothetical protein|nr:DUF2807 domain-containing protein [Prevotellaceae bacterium]
MKKILLLIILSGVAIAAAGQLTETRKVAGFTGISASGVFVITVTKGTAESLAITADEEVMPYVRSEVQDGVLKLYLAQGKRQRMKVTTLKAVVTVKDLSSVYLSGACRLTGESVFTPPAFNGDLSGASSLQLTVQTTRLSMEASGAGKVTLNAAVENTAKFDLSGAIKVQGEINARRLTVDMSGSSRMYLSGAADKASFDLSGVANVKAGNLLSKEVEVETSGASRVEVHVSASLRVHTSGASAVYYKGNPSSFDVKTSGASKLKKTE